MKIQFISNYGSLYGANRSLLSVVYFFHKKGHQVHVLLPKKGEMSFELEKTGIAYSIIPYFSSFLYVKPIFKYLILPFLYIIDLAIFPLIVNKIRKYKPDVIYSNTSAENIGIFIAKILKVKHILHIREFMSKDHGAYFLFGKGMKRRFIALSDGIICVSNSVLNYIYPHENYLKKLNAQVIYNGITIPKTLKARNFPTAQIKFGLVGIFDIAKQQHLAIEYFNKILDMYPVGELHFYGDKEGRYKSRIIDLVKKLRLEQKVFFHGFIGDNSLIYNSMDILLMFSRSEGFGRVTIEAMRYGIPVIGFNNAGTAEIIEDKITGCLFSDYSTFEDSVKFLIGDNMNYCRISKNAHQHVYENFREEVYINRIEQFVRKLL
jgi:glycosyltransferase involved in cell wall biosynthesis